VGSPSFGKGSMSKKIFSFRRALDNDFNLTTNLILPFLLWGLYMLWRILGGSGQVVLILAIGITVLAPYLIWRKLHSLRASFERGVETPGELVKVYFHQDRGRIDFTYTYQETKYSSSVAIHKNANTRDFDVGQAVTVIVDPEKSDHALLAELYT
jgi:hypothetical protein